MKKHKHKEVPHWKKALIKEEETISSAESSDSSDDPEADAAWRKRAAAALAARKEMLVAAPQAAGSLTNVSKRPREKDEVSESEGGHNIPSSDLPADDDDDDDVDLTNYALCSGDEKGDEGEELDLSVPPPPSAEELLLAREAVYGGQKIKTFFVDDNLRSQEKSAGSERSCDRKKAMAGALVSCLPHPSHPTQQHTYIHRRRRHRRRRRRRAEAATAAAAAAAAAASPIRHLASAEVCPNCPTLP